MPYVMRKIKNKDLYRVYNNDTKHVYSLHTTKEKAKAQIRLLNQITSEEQGGKLSVENLTGLLKSSYNPAEKVGDFELNKELSTKTSKVYYDPNKNQSVVAHRGTKGTSDWLNNLVYAIGGTKAYKMTPRYKEAQRTQQRAQKMYGNENVSTIGSSQGGLQAELLGKNSKEIITHNKATRLFGNTKHKNQFDVRSKADIISYLNPLQLKTNRDIEIPAESYLNPLKEHSIETLNRLNPHQEIGKSINLAPHIDNGLSKGELEEILNKHGIEINGIYSKDKLPHNLKNGWYIINMQNEKAGNGTHWVCFKYMNDGEMILYADSFGFEPPCEVMEKAKGNLMYSNKDIQDFNSSCCGYFCIGFILNDNNGKQSVKRFCDFLDRFSSNTLVNDALLKRFFDF